MMARRICTVYVTNIGDDLTTKETAKAKPLVVNDYKAFKIEQKHLKERDTWQGSHKAVTEGLWSGQGQLVCDNWDNLKNFMRQLSCYYSNFKF